MESYRTLFRGPTKNHFVDCVAPRLKITWQFCVSKGKSWNSILQPISMLNLLFILIIPFSYILNTEIFRKIKFFCENPVDTYFTYSGSSKTVGFLTFTVIGMKTSGFQISSSMDKSIVTYLPLLSLCERNFLFGDILESNQCKRKLSSRLKSVYF